jgi:hypothetical protein
VPELWRGALASAISAADSAYGTLFVELAVRLQTHVAGYDVALQRKFPKIVKAPADILH